MLHLFCACYALWFWEGDYVADTDMYGREIGYLTRRQQHSAYYTLLHYGIIRLQQLDREDASE